MALKSEQSINYLVAVDGGGTGTRVILAQVDGTELARVQGGPSGLVHGRDNAWKVIMEALESAFQSAGVEKPALSEIGLACGLAGVNNAAWGQEFIALNPGFGALIAETDSYTNVVGAHQGQAGVVVALGTGSVGLVLRESGERHEVGGWGFPVGDEASGAWMGLHAMNYLQRTLDGRVVGDNFSKRLFDFCGGSIPAVFTWLANANQTRYAALAPIVLEFSNSSEAAIQILKQAADEVVSMAKALDPEAKLPFAMCGGLAQAVLPYLPIELKQRLREPWGDSVAGAKLLIQRHINQILKQAA